jgi:membrane-associated phospholipid phosphatase
VIHFAASFGSEILRSSRETYPLMFRSINRRNFLAGAFVATPLARLLHTFMPEEVKNSRTETTLELRKRTALVQSQRPLASMASNGDERVFPNRIGCYAKGLLQNQYGEVQPAAYDALLSAIKSGRYVDFEGLPRGGGRRLSNPQAAFAFHLEGGDPHTFDVPPAPSITSQAASHETSELYWQALCRDVAFRNYKTSQIVAQAAKHLGTTPSNVFRGSTKGDLTGPYVSQFLLKSVPYGSGRVDQRYWVPNQETDFMATSSEFSQIQSGIPPWREATYDPTPRYIRNGRDLAEYVHYDFAYQAYLNAALILVNSSPKSVLNCNQFKSAANPYRYSTVEDGFVTFGSAEVTDWLGRVTTAALKAAYFQKWMVHRRVRPEALGGLIHQSRMNIRKYPVPSSLLESEAVSTVFSRTGTYLLPQAYPEGCPLHPSYPSGHAAIAGACSIILKACFDGLMLLPACVEPSADGLSLVPCPDYSPTVEDEINKLAFNIAMGRNWAGIHYRSDNVAGLRLGEDVAISILQDLACTYTEDFRGFLFTRIDGTSIHITPQGEVIAS